MVRSLAAPAMDMINVANTLSVECYLSHEQYGAWPFIELLKN